jgi:MarR family transcriptional regulator, transcriptional regulator for hemolysin
MTPPRHPPIGLSLNRTARLVGRAFDDELGRAGGSLPVWLTLLTVKMRKSASQRELAAAIGIQGATLTHHLNALEAAGLLVRRRDPANRRTHQVELTPAGEEKFLQLREAAIAFDKRLRDGFDDQEIAMLDRALARLRGNVGEEE